MAHRRIYVHDDKLHNAVDLFGDVYDNKDSEVAKVLREEFDRQREERLNDELDCEFDPIPCKTSSYLKSDKELYTSLIARWRLYTVIFIETLIIIFVSAYIGYYYKSAFEAFLVFFCASIGVYPITFLIYVIIRKLTIMSYDIAIRRAERKGD